MRKYSKIRTTSLFNTERQESTVMLNNNVKDGDEKRQEEEIVKKEGPDGGWGWVVVLSSFILNCVLDGICNSFGIIMDPLVKDLSLDPVSVVFITLGHIFRGAP